MKRCVCLFILLFTIVATPYAQGLSRIFIEAGPQSSFFKHNANAVVMFDFETRPVIKTNKFDMPTSMGNPIQFAFGGGYEYYTDNTQLFDTRIMVSILRRGYICTYNDGFFRFNLFGSIHYKFSKAFDQQYICPEIGFSYNFSKGIGLVPSLNYYLPLVTKERWNRGFFLSLKLRINLYARYP